jgi:eukaryotic-like serine/threonine-protein kinase
MARRSTMNPDRWRRIADLYHLARGRPDAERQSFLAEACGNDEALLREVQELLDQHGATSDLLQVLEPTELALVARLDDAPDSRALIGHSIGPYQVQRLLGAGAMGEVYCARDTKLGRDVALKVLRWAQTADDGRRRRFENEARVLAC